MNKLAIIGAGYLQLPIYLKAREMGIETIGFSWEEGAVSKKNCSKFYPYSILEKEKILQTCCEEKVEGVVTIASDLAVPTVSYIAEKMGLVGNTVESSILSTNKFLMRNAFIAHKLQCPGYFRIDNIGQADMLRKPLMFPLIVKPVDRSGSMGVTKINSISELHKALINALDASILKQAILEEFIDGQEVSVESISYKSMHNILTITDKVTSGHPNYVELEHHQPSLLSEKTKDCIMSETIKALDALKIVYGASHTEFIISKNGLFITECGARMGGDFIGSDLVPLSTGYDFLRGVIEVALNKFEKPEKKWKRHSGVYFYSVESPKIGEVIRENKFSEYKVRSEIFSNPLKELKQSSDRTGYFIYQSEEKLILK